MKVWLARLPRTLPIALLLALTSPALLASDGNLSRVNGSIRVESGREAGSVETVSGSIDIGRDAIVGDIDSVNGDIEVGPGSRIDGGILVEKPDFSFFRSKHIPKVVIGAGAEVNGTLRFEREVELHIANDAKVGKIVGATAIRE